MSSVSSLCRLLIFRFTSSLARVLELMVLYRLSRLFRMVFTRLAVLCVGACLLFTTGFMGVFVLCSFSRALRESGVGFFWLGI